jgi:photosystem I reaction center subunit XII
MPLSDAQVLTALFMALFPGILAYKLCLELYKA